MTTKLTLELADFTLEVSDKSGLSWAQGLVTEHHYLHKPVDVRCRPIAYIIRCKGSPAGCLIFGRPESTKCNGWYGSVEDVATEKCRLTRWQILNLARVWLAPSIQHGGPYYIKNAATYVIAQALRRVTYDYLVCKPPVWMEEPYQIRECLSYCDTRIHSGALYRAANFQLVRKNKDGIETYVIPLRNLTHAERAHIKTCSQKDKRAQKLRAARMQLSWVNEESEVGV